MLLSEYVERVRRYGVQHQVDLREGDIAATEKLARTALSLEIAVDTREQSLLCVDYAVPITGGSSGVLGTLFPNMLISTIESVRHPVHGKFSRLPNVSDLDHPRNVTTYWFAIGNDILSGRHGDGVTTPDDGTLTVTANTIAIFGTAPSDTVAANNKNIPPTKVARLVQLGFQFSQAPPQEIE